MVGSELLKYIGEGGRLVRNYLITRQRSPAIFIDEIDAIGAKRLDAN